MEVESLDLDTRTQEILLAASNHDLATLKSFLRVPGAASVQDPETGFTPLHAAIAACGPAPDLESNESATFAPALEHRVDVTDSLTDGTTNGHTEETEEKDDEEVDIEKAKATVKELFLSGAIWNDLDTNDETPGCLAWRLGRKELYELCVEAGVRAEMLMNLMGGYEQLSDDDEDEEEEEEEEGGEKVDLEASSKSGEAVEDTQVPLAEAAPTPTDVNSADYLASDLTFSDNKLLDSDNNGVMMSWETRIMELTSSLLAPTPNLRILNIGFGMGIIDTLFASTTPSSHHIIEAHPAVLSQMALPNSSFNAAWEASKPGKNVVHAGKWQDIVPGLLEQGEVFDVIYFDTFGEDYQQLRKFFMEDVVGLLSEEGRFGFFNGLGADRRVCYDVYCRVVELDLCDAGLDVEWTDVEVESLGEEGEGEWEGVRRRYWTLEKYRLPVCKFLG